MKKVVVILILIAGFLVTYSLVDDFSFEENLDQDLDEDEWVIKPTPEETPDEESEILGEMAIIIDDLGYSNSLNEKLLKIEEPITLAILPFLEGTESALNYFRGVDNFEIILHMPLEPISGDQVEENMIMTTHSQIEMKTIFNSALGEMGSDVIGINNHKGSKFTSDEEKMRKFLELVKGNDLFFVDSFTINTSVGYPLAKEMGIPTAKRDIFLDYVDDIEEIRERLYEARDVAISRGSVVVIGHHKENTISVLKEELPKMKDIRFIKASEIVY